MEARLIETIEVGDTLGEGVLWRSSDATVWWTDIAGRRMHRLAWPSLRVATFETPERLCSFAFIEGRDDVVLGAFESGFAFFAPESGRIAWIVKPDAAARTRLNDGRADPDGRFWAGSMGEGGGAPRGALYCVDAHGRVRAMLDGVGISNGLCWSPDGSRMYFADSVRREIRTARFDREAGVFDDFRLFAAIEEGEPDGAVTDAAGTLWSALWGAGRIATFAPDGREGGSVELPAPQVTCPAFGGPSGNLLFVTSARDGLSDEALAASPLSGALFVVETDARGHGGQRFKPAGPMPL